MSESCYPKLPPGVLETGTLRIDWSGYRLIEDCQRKAQHALAWRRVPDKTEPALEFGKAFHKALDARQKAIMAGDDKVLPRMEQALEEAYAGLVMPEDDHRTLGRAKEVVGLYVDRWKDDGKDFEILASERAHEKDLGTVCWRYLGQKNDGEWHYKEPEVCTKVIWQGKTDGIWRRRDTDRRAIKDTKTMEKGDLQREQRKYRLSGQMRMYCWLFGDLFGPINEAVIDLAVVRQPLLRPTPKSQPRTELERVVQSYSDRSIEECKRDILAKIGQWLEACGREQPAPMSTTQCLYCPHFEVCEQEHEEDRVEWLLSGGFKNNTWDPMEAK